MESIEIYDALAPVLLGLLTWGLKSLTTYLQSKTKNELVHGALGRLDDAIIVGVKSVNQTLKRELKKANADGKLTDDEKKKLNGAVWDTLKRQYGGFEGLKTAMGVIGLGGETAVADFVSNRIEAHVHDEKASRPQSPAR